MDPYEFQCESADPGRDLAEGEMAYRIEERNGRFLVIQHLAAEAWNGEVIEWAATREEAVVHIREYLASRQGRRR